MMSNTIVGFRGSGLQSTHGYILIILSTVNWEITLSSPMSASLFRLTFTEKKKGLCEMISIIFQCIQGPQFIRKRSTLSNVQVFAYKTTYNRTIVLSCLDRDLKPICRFNNLGKYPTLKQTTIPIAEPPHRSRNHIPPQSTHFAVGTPSIPEYSCQGLTESRTSSPGYAEHIFRGV